MDFAQVIGSKIMKVLGAWGKLEVRGGSPGWKRGEDDCHEEGGILPTTQFLLGPSLWMSSVILPVFSSKGDILW